MKSQSSGTIEFGDPKVLTNKQTSTDSGERNLMFPPPTTTAAAATVNTSIHPH